MISNPWVPERIRQALDIESGLNDGVSLPFVPIFMSLAQQASDTGPVSIFVGEIGIAFLAFLVADEGGGSGVIAAFVAGLTYGRVTKGKLRKNQTVAGDLGLGLIHVSLLAFGAAILMPALDDLSWQVVVMALPALAVARMVAVAISMIGTVPISSSALSATSLRSHHGIDG